MDSEDIRRIISDCFNVKIEKVVEDAEFRNDLGLDSLDEYDRINFREDSDIKYKCTNYDHILSKINIKELLKQGNSLYQICEIVKNLKVDCINSNSCPYLTIMNYETGEIHEQKT